MYIAVFRKMYYDYGTIIILLILIAGKSQIEVIDTAHVQTQAPDLVMYNVPKANKSYTSHAIICLSTMMCTFTALWKLSGVEECDEISVVHSSQGQLIEWNGLKLHIHAGSLPEALQQCTIFIKASLAGDYEFPENTSLVSAIFWLRCEPQCTFTKPITVEIQHCSTKQDLSKLKVVRAFCSQNPLPYMFKRLKGGRFDADTSYGALEVTSFSGFGVTEDNPDSQRLYYNQLYYSNHSQQRYDIHVIYTWNTDAHINASHLFNQLFLIVNLLNCMSSM